MARGRLAGALLSGAYAAGWSLVRHAPEPLMRAVFRAAGNAVAARNGKGVRRLRGNLRRVVGPDVPEEQLDELVRKAVRAYALYWYEVFKLPALSRETVLARTRPDGRDRFDAYVARGSGVILALPHMGNWDHAGAYMTASGTYFTTVAERLEPASLFERFVEFREGLGMEVIPHTGGEAPPFELLAERLRAGGVLCLLADRDLTAGGVPVTFFGATATMPAGPAALCVRTGAALVPTTLTCREGALTIRWHEAVPDPGPECGDERHRVAVMTQGMADVFAEAIAASPADWHMLARLWREDLDPSRSAGSPSPAAAAG